MKDGGKKKHGPVRFASYARVHENVMAGYRKQGFVQEDALVFNNMGDGVIELRGSITCTHGIVVTVIKYIDILNPTDDGDQTVQTRMYQYVAKLSGHGVILRYCSPHEDEPDQTPHHHRHHKHICDPTGINPEVITTYDDDDERPTLGEVLKELAAWASAHPEFEKVPHSYRQ